jgi:hypothetical protein
MGRTRRSEGFVHVWFSQQAAQSMVLLTFDPIKLRRCCVEILLSVEIHALTHM